ncbi:alanyl-tRNA editing protein [Clostridium uliginosum]|uniref:Alanine--tRNA ligase n=1 Tax=Clostridium uliginosum TaxID=119641 RepID=A0A1I1HAB5_9CLOT|nr:DHHA1 domain-containing protein [Clostridium uliginosum]SFC18433.1 alanyl-tRNA synthetase [Clostridium uliginosum]
MEKLFYEDQYLTNFTAEIIEIQELNGKFHVVLDKTAFFPGGGGQYCDLGSIGEHEVLDVYEKDNLIYHIVEKKPIKIHKVKCSLDWNRRSDGMNQHLAQHVLSACFFKLFNINTIAVHHGNEVSTIDFQTPLNEEQIKKSERYANKIIGEALKVEFLIPSKKDLKSMNLRRDLPNTNEEIRIVKIGDLDINACCGVHPSSTLDLRLIKIKKWEKHKQGTRIEFLAGTKAINDSFLKDDFSSSICKYLNCNENEAVNGIKNLNNNLKESNEENKKLKIDLAKYEVKEMIENANKIGEINVVKKIYTNQNVKYVSNLISKLTEIKNTIVLIAVISDEKANLIFSCSKNLINISMNEILKDAITLIDGRGGGSLTLAQGAGKNNSNLESTLDYAFNKIKNTP